MLSTEAGSPTGSMRPAGYSHGEWLLTEKASVKVDLPSSARSRRSSWLNMSSSDAPHDPTNTGSTNDWRSITSLKPLPRKKPRMLSKCASPP
ncbi:Uncharacterised protein [Bordetella pertussis]|nr:Uncharacterised protein [Bordetella pertussis]